MNQTLSRSEYGTVSTLSDTHLSRVRKEAKDVTQTMIAFVHNDPVLLAQYALWLDLNEQTGKPITSNPEAAFILSQYNGGYRQIVDFIPAPAKTRFIQSVTGVIGDNTPSGPGRG